MKKIKTTMTALLFTAAILPWVSCKKENTTIPNTSHEKLLGKWNWISEVYNDYYSGSSHITTYNFPAGAYMEFKNDGKYTQSSSGIPMTSDYSMIDETKIWLVMPGNIYEVKVLTASDMQLYKKDVNGPDYYESTLNFKR